MEFPSSNPFSINSQNQQLNGVKNKENKPVIKNQALAEKISTLQENRKSSNTNTVQPLANHQIKQSSDSKEKSITTLFRDIKNFNLENKNNSVEKTHFSEIKNDLKKGNFSYIQIDEINEKIHISSKDNPLQDAKNKAYITKSGKLILSHDQRATFKNLEKYEWKTDEPELKNIVDKYNENPKNINIIVLSNNEFLILNSIIQKQQTDAIDDKDKTSDDTIKTRKSYLTEKDTQNLKEDIKLKETSEKPIKQKNSVKQTTENLFKVEEEKNIKAKIRKSNLEFESKEKDQKAEADEINKMRLDQNIAERLKNQKF